MKLSLKKLDAPILDALSLVGKIAQTEGVAVFLVGGMVRDLYLGKPTCDVDVVVKGNAIAFAEKVAKKIKGNLVKHPSFGTATIALNSGVRLDFVTARKEVYRKAGALPEVSSGDMQSDAFRRDFSVNALAMSLDPQNFGEIIDHVGGLADIKGKCVRALHEGSFVDDPTRIFRAARYEQRYDFRIHRSTLSWIKGAIKANAFKTISMKRYMQEIEKIFSEQDPAKVFARLNQWGVFDYLSPKLVPGYAVIRRFSERINDADGTNCYSDVSIDSLFWLAFLSGSDAKTRDRVLDKMPFTKVQQKLIRSLEYVQEVSRTLNKSMSPSQLVRCLQGVSAEGVCYLRFTIKSRQGQVNIQRYNAIRDTKLLMTGNDLRDMGVKSGARIGEILNKVLEMKLDKGFRTKAQEIKVARAIIKDEGSGVI